jgi:hexosaminidase
LRWVWRPDAVLSLNSIDSKIFYMERLDEAEIKYARTMYEPIFTVAMEGDKIKVSLTTEIEGIDVHYSWDESHPDRYYQKYAAPLIVPSDALTLKLVTYHNGKQVGRQINMHVEELKKRAGKK